MARQRAAPPVYCALRTSTAAVLAAGLAFGVGIPMGFVLRPKMREFSDDAFGTALGIAIPVTAVALMWLFKGAPMPKRGVRSIIAPGQEEWQAKIIAEQEAYAADRNKTGSCPHLRAVEAAIRAAGIRTSLTAYSGTGRSIWAQCRIHEAELRRRFDLPRWVEYKQWYDSDRDNEDTPRADLVCQRCRENETPGWSIMVIHPESYSKNTPWFSSAPAAATGGGPGKGE